MKYDPQKHHRKSYRLQTHDYAAPAAYFVTLVTGNRDCLFGDVVDKEMVFNDLGKIADEYFSNIPEHFPNAEINIHQVMPNHVHGIIVIRDDLRVGATDWVAPTITAPTKPHGPQGGSIGAILGSYKMAVTRYAIASLKMTNIWQRNYHDHIIRNETEWQNIRDYISSNPADWLKDEHHPERGS